MVAVKRIYETARKDILYILPVFYYKFAFLFSENRLICMQIACLKIILNSNILI